MNASADVFLAKYLASKSELLELAHKVFVELDQPLGPVCPRCEEGGAEVERPLLLPEPCAGDGAHTGCVEHAEAVELVSGAALLLCLLEGFLGQRDGGEEVHGALGDG